jgi:hypothetical protein
MIPEDLLLSPDPLYLKEVYVDTSQSIRYVHMTWFTKTEEKARL